MLFHVHQTLSFEPQTNFKSKKYNNHNLSQTIFNQFYFQPILSQYSQSLTALRSLPQCFSLSSLWKRISSPFSLSLASYYQRACRGGTRRGGPIIIAETRTDAKGYVAGYKRGNAPHKARPSRVCACVWIELVPLVGVPVGRHTTTDSLFLQTPTVFSTLRISFSLLLQIVE